MSTRAFSDAEERDVVREYAAGASALLIAKRRGASRNAVYSVLTRHGMARRSGAPSALFDEAGAQRLRREYEAGASTGELAKGYSTTQATILASLRRAGATIRPRGQSIRAFTPEQVADMRRRWEAGESQTKIAQAYGCSQVAVSRTLALHGIEVVHRRPRGERHGSWRGGRVRVQGYVHVRVEPDDPMAEMRTVLGYVAEHRLVMARALGRPLRRDEQVHHVNGKRDDNRLENLQLRHGAHGNGGALRCAECGSHNLVPTTLD